MDFAYAVVHTNPLQVFFAEDEEVLSEVLAREIIAQTHGQKVAPQTLKQLRKALLDRQWGTAIEIWIKITDIGISIYGSCDEYWTRDMLLDNPYEQVMKTAPLFSSSNA